MKLTEKASYVKGLVEGLNPDFSTKEGKIISALLELVDEMATAVTDIQNDISEIDEDLDSLNDYVEELDDDLDAVETYLEDDGEEDDEEDEEIEGCTGDCENCDGSACGNDDYYEIVCPSCGETVCFDGELDPENLVCPACGEKFGCLVEEDDFKKLSENK